ncbi:hypothetical protein B0O95_105233 [Mycetohabitans endofungorum]|uniref:Uncharacterized protein n=1 Tax=Mycetohabitans endofungorum TaxID=417203 RepID=A0A2P5KBG4_9BURK|nr:hypothetical protein B0O95_105233 [Mycetohabitans endofungorum]
MKADQWGQEPSMTRPRLVVDVIDAGQHDPRSQCHCLRHLSVHRQRRDLLVLRFAQHEFRLRSFAHRRFFVSVA